MKVVDNHPEKWKTYCLTFCAYLALHTMRMTYSEIKPYFQTTYKISNLMLGILDASTYMALAIGFGLRFLISSRKIMLREYFLFTAIAILGFLIIPVTSLVEGSLVTSNVFTQSILPITGLIVFGFFQFAAWPSLLTITNQYFDLKKEGAMMGFWASNSSIGNIVGFALTGLIVDVLQLGWQTAMIVVACLQLILAFEVYFVVTENPFQEENSLVDDEFQSQENPEEEGSVSNYQNFCNYVEFIGKIWGPTSNKLFILINGLFKAITYSFLIWMPLYLANQHYTLYVSTIPIIFNLGTLVGSFVLGSQYQQLENADDSCLSRLKANIQKYNLLYSCLIVIACLLIFCLVKVSIFVYFLLSGICGLFLGGTFTMLAGNEVIKIVGSNKEYVNYLSTFSMMTNNMITAIIQLLIGLLLNQQTAGNELFWFLLGVAVVSTIILFVRIKYYQ